ncbi:unnamed protein product, partial [Rotaria sp. Silwood1]
MLTKKEIEQLIDKKNLSLRIIKPTEYVICNQCEELLIYQPSFGTNSLSKHVSSCQKVKTTVSHNQTTINQFYASSKNEPAIPDRIKQEIKIACVEFAALDSRSFKTIHGIGFKNLAQKIFDAGKYLPISKGINVEKLLPHPTTVSREVNKLYNQKHQQLVSICRRLKTVWVSQDVHYISCLLHPSLKQFQIAPHEKSKAVDLVKAELLKRQSSTSSGSSIINITPCSSTKSSTTSKSQQLTPTTQNVLLECFDHPAEGADLILVPSSEKELTQYLSSNITLEPNGDVLLFWKKHQNTFPTLASI